MERKIVKIRVDMYSDTKFKIIDTMEDRDLIHYIWTRLLTLAGKVNLEGELYLSKNIAYTIETLALEFNRSAKKVALALKVFMDLEMVELTENNVYKVRNFSKHQNIKKKKKDINKDKLEIVDNEKVFVDKYNNDNTIIGKEVIVSEKEKFNEFRVGEVEKSNIVNSIINKKENKNREFDLFKRDVKNINNEDEVIKSDVSKYYNGFTISNKHKFNKIDLDNSNNKFDSIKRKVIKENEFDVPTKNNVEKIKKDSSFNEAGFNSNNTINACIHSAGKDNNIKDNIKTKRNYVLDGKTVNKDILGNEFAFEKSNNKKRKNTSKSKKKDADEIICDYASEDENIEICEFTDDVPKGNVIATFEF